MIQAPIDGTTAKSKQTTNTSDKKQLSVEDSSEKTNDKTNDKTSEKTSQKSPDRHPKDSSKPRGFPSIR